VLPSAINLAPACAGPRIGESHRPASRNTAPQSQQAVRIISQDSLDPESQKPFHASFFVHSPYLKLEVECAGELEQSRFDDFPVTGSFRHLEGDRWASVKAFEAQPVELVQGEPLASGGARRDRRIRRRPGA